MGYYANERTVSKNQKFKKFNLISDYFNSHLSGDI